MVTKIWSESSVLLKYFDTECNSQYASLEKPECRRNLSGSRNKAPASVRTGIQFQSPNEIRRLGSPTVIPVPREGINKDSLEQNG